MKLAFSIPETLTIKVIYAKGGVTYSATIPNPKTADSLLCTMLDRQVGSSQIVRLEPIQPRQEFQRGHPAAHRMARYATAAEH